MEVELVKVDTVEDSQQALKVAIPAMQVNSGISVTCRARTPQCETASTIQVVPSPLQPQAEGATNIHRLISNAQFSFLCTLMHHEVCL
jgi:hypothetical protein